jgi:hypothetical protein
LRAASISSGPGSAAQEEWLRLEGRQSTGRPSLRRPVWLGGSRVQPRKGGHDRNAFLCMFRARYLTWPSKPRPTDAAGARFSPGVTCRSMNRLVASERLSTASKARSSTSPTMSSDTSRDQPSAVLNATTSRALVYWPLRKLRTIVSRSASVGGVSTKARHHPSNGGASPTAPTARRDAGVVGQRARDRAAHSGVRQVSSRWLERENRQLWLERDILSKAAAWFAAIRRLLGRRNTIASKGSGS